VFVSRPACLSKISLKLIYYFSSNVANKMKGRKSACENATYLTEVNERHIKSQLNLNFVSF